jgi:hypothetical protein
MAADLQDDWDLLDVRVLGAALFGLAHERPSRLLISSWRPWSEQTAGLGGFVSRPSTAKP